MKVIKSAALCSLILLMSGYSHAWVVSSNVTVKEITVWEDLDTKGVMHFQLSDGRWCYVPNGQKTIQSIILTLYVSGKTLDQIHCYDNADSNAGGSVPAAHKLHRLIAK